MPASMTSSEQTEPPMSTDRKLRHFHVSFFATVMGTAGLAAIFFLGGVVGFCDDILDLAVRTIESHRKNIRAKLGLKNRKVNLRTHLLTL